MLEKDLPPKTGVELPRRSFDKLVRATSADHAPENAQIFRVAIPSRSFLIGR